MTGFLFGKRECYSFLLAGSMLLSPLFSTEAVFASSDLSKPAKAETKGKDETKASAETKAKARAKARAGASQTSKSSSQANKDVLRLTKAVKPLSYELTFEPDLEKFTYKGKEKVVITVAAPQKEIVLNSIDLKLSDIEILALDASGAPLKSAKKIQGKLKIDEKNEQAHLNFAQSLPQGKYQLQFNFEGILNDQLRGFYRSYYKDSAGEKHWVCSSQMEPADARRMFPCFDEPEFKATFQLTAVIDSRLSAISNAPVDHIKEIKEQNKKAVVFKPSPKMSTYLMVLVVGEFNATEERKSCDIPIRVWAPAGQEKMGAYSLAAACEIMVFLQDYFGIKFPAKKLDLIAIPDFAPGAMENLGAITFKDSLLLIDEKTGSNFAKRSALSVIAHEMAHQWFGDLVTNRWWDDLWLNEAFATWAATKTENALRPQWRVRTKGVLDRVEAMDIDQLASTRAIHAHVGNPKQASEMFDAITYDKGSAVLRMLEVFVGEKVFQKGVHDYLEAHKWDNATSDDLWKSIAAAAKNVPVPQMMQTWIMQAGFPLVRVENKAGSKSITLSQEKFLVMPGAHADATRWIVPVMARGLAKDAGKDANKSASNTALLLDKKQNQFKLPASGEAVLANAGASGFYRVLYTPQNLKVILDKFQTLSPEEKLSLVSDISVLSRKDLLPVEDSLSLMLKVKGEEDIVVLNRLISKFASLRHFMDSKTKAQYEKFLCAYLLPYKEKYGWEEQKGEEETVKDLRADLVRILGTYAQDRQTIKEANELYAKYMKDKESVSPDIIGSVLTIVAYNGSSAEFDQIRAACKTATNPQDEKRLLLALPHFRQHELVERTLKLCLDAETRATDSVALLSSLLSNQDSNEQAWKFTAENWDKLSKKFPPRFNKRIAANCAHFDSAEMEKTLKEYFAAHPWEMAKAAIGRALEEVHVSVLYRTRNAERIRNWVAKQAI